MKHKMFVPIKDKERWNLVAMLIKNYPGQASMTGGAMVETELSDLAGLFVQWDGSEVILTTQVVAEEAPAPEVVVTPSLEPGGNGAGKKVRKAEPEKSRGRCLSCGKDKWLNDEELCKWCAKRAERNRQVLTPTVDLTVDLMEKATSEVQVTAAAQAESGDAGDNLSPACSKCGRTGLKLGKKSGMCADCNIKTAAEGTSKSLQASERRAGGGMQVLAQGMRRGSGQALKARRLG